MEQPVVTLTEEMLDMLAGMPNWLVMLEIAALAAVTFLLYIGLNLRRAQSAPYQYPAFDLMRLPVFDRMVKSRWFQFSFQLPVVLVFLLILFGGVYGNQVSGQNIALPLTWTIWWAGLIFIILFVGKFWCFVCPWNAIAEWLERLSFWWKRSSTLSLNLKWPAKWRNIYLATGLFIGLTWLELGWGITTSARATAYLAIFMVVLTVVCAMIFERKSFCRYACLVGRISGMYSLFSPVEVRNRDHEVCRSCHTNDCLVGNDQGYACPTFQYLGTMDTNTYCILCSECVKTCPHDNVAVNVRPFGADLADHTKGQADEAYLVVVMLAMTFFHGLTMTPFWGVALEAIGEATGFGKLASFSLGMTGMLLLPALLYTGIVWLARFGVGKSLLSMKQVFVTFAYPFLPVALFYHLAHNAQHFFIEGQKVISMASDPFGWGWDLFGTASLYMSPMLNISSVWGLQAVLLVLGQIAGVAILVSISRRLLPNRRQAMVTQIPVILLLLGLSLVGLWICSMPMMTRA